MTAVKYHAHRLPQKSIWPISQTSLTSGCLKQNSLAVVSDVQTSSTKFAYHTIREVYRTKAAMTTVKINPGTKPRTE